MENIEFTEAEIVEPKTNLAIDRLKSAIERIERLNEERKDLANDIKDIFVELKSSGFEPKIVREVLRLRKMDPTELEEHEYTLSVYKNGLGMQC
ncbi:MAG: DUF2312 domain-containing protein [Pseudomonadota bacterium]|nr:DUF2312 domain-containing protein [Pseudomonadota bacterium]